MEVCDVVQRVLSGDRQAYAQVVARYERPIFRYLGRMGLTQEHAEEIAQETFLRAWSRLGEFDEQRGSFGTWIYTIAHRLALNALARASTRQEVPLLPEQDVAAAHPSPPEAFAAAERRRVLRAALLQLSPADRSAIALAYIEELSFGEIAHIERCSVGAVKTRLHRARRRLAALLEKDVD